MMKSTPTPFSEIPLTQRINDAGDEANNKIGIYICLLSKVLLPAVCFQITEFRQYNPGNFSIPYRQTTGCSSTVCYKCNRTYFIV